MENLNLILFIAFISFIILIGIFSTRQVRTTNQYLLANRKTRLFALIATLVMTELNTSTLLAFSAVGYSASWWGLTLPLVFLIGLIFYALTVAKRWKQWNGISVARYFAERYGRDVGYLAAGILFLAMLGFTATYVKSLTLIFVPIFPTLSPWLLSAFLIMVIFLMTLRGGLIAIIRTDVISFIVMLLFFPALVYFAAKLPAITTVPPLDLQQMQTILPPRFVLSLIVLTMFSYILAPWYGQKIVAAHAEKIAYWAVMVAAVLIFILYGIGIVATNILRTKGIVLLQPESAVPYLIHTAFPAGFQGLAYGALFCIAATTLSGVWSAMVALLVGHVAVEMKRPLLLSVILTVCCALLSYLGANLFVDQILNKMILANIPVVALSFALLAGFYWRKASRVGVYASVIVGLVWAIGCYVVYGDQGMYTWYWALYGVPLIFVAGWVGSIWSSMNSNKQGG